MKLSKHTTHITGLKQRPPFPNVSCGIHWRLPVLNSHYRTVRATMQVHIAN